MNAGTTKQLRRIGVALLLIAMVASAGCVGAGGGSNDRLDGETNAKIFDLPYDGSGDVYRFVDREAGVVCYVSRIDKGAGVHCLPIEQTDLAR